MGVGVGQILRQAALRWRGRTAVLDVGPSGLERRTSYEALDADAQRVAAALHARGVRSGARVALCAGNSAAFVSAWFGAVYAGATLVPLSILTSAAELRERVRQTRCEAILVDAARLALVRSADLESAISTILVLGDLPSGTPAADPVEGPQDRDPSRPALILSTSGTTGRARAAVVSHAALVAQTASMVHHTLGVTARDCTLGVLPLTHSFGCRAVMLASLFAGAPVVMMTGRFDAARALEAVVQQRVSWIPAVPTMFAAWAALGRPLESDRLRWCLSAGAPLPADLAARAEALLGAEVRQGYGMTEATLSTVNAPPDRRVFGCAGRPVWGVEVLVADTEGGALPPGARGEVLVRGGNLMSGYLDEPDATAAALRGGWMHSGDVGFLDEEGRLFVLDRLKDLIVRGGYKVLPAEVEAVLAGHRDVADAVVVGRPDAFYGEEIVAVLVPRPGAQIDAGEVVAWSRERLSRTKYPREIALLERLPLGPSGKVLRREVRRLVVERAVAVVRPSPDGHGAAGPEEHWAGA